MRSQVLELFIALVSLKRNPARARVGHNSGCYRHYMCHTRPWSTRRPDRARPGEPFPAHATILRSTPGTGGGSILHAGFSHWQARHQKIPGLPAGQQFLLNIPRIMPILFSEAPDWKGTMQNIPARLQKAATIWWPDWLYESMPFVYAAAGILAIIHFESPDGYAAGALLLLAAVVILKMRRDYRNLKSTVKLARELIDMTQDTRR